MLNPVGNGIPIARPSGTSSAALMAIFAGKASPICDASSFGSAAASTAMVTAIIPRTNGKRPPPAIQRRESKLPAPLESSSRKTTTVRA